MQLNSPSTFSLVSFLDRLPSPRNALFFHTSQVPAWLLVVSKVVFKELIVFILLLFPVLFGRCHGHFVVMPALLRG